VSAVRPATPADVPAIRRVVRDAYLPAVALVGREPGPMGDDYEALTAAGRVHVLEDGDGVCGVLVLVPEPDALLLDNVAVAPGRQGRGIGRILMDFAEAEARRLGLQAVRLYTNERMEANVALYARRGYVETDRREEMGFRRVFMRKDLAG
jgi:ribosomal protein S18 acetylase RimI-like enzyme